MMGGCNLILSCDYPFDKSEKDCKLIKEYLKDIPDTTVLVFWYNSVKPDIKKRPLEGRGSGVCKIRFKY